LKEAREAEEMNQKADTGAVGATETSLDPISTTDVPEKV